MNILLIYYINQFSSGAILEQIMQQITIVIAFAIAQGDHAHVAVYSTLDSPVIIASMGGPNVAYSAMDSLVIIASMGGPNVIVQWIVQLF